jgi:hypothetical protein
VKSREKEHRIAVKDRESTMIEQMTEDELAKVKEEFAKELAVLVARARLRPPRFERVAPPIDPVALMASGPGPLYDGFEEDIKRMRRGLPPIGPRK